MKIILKVISILVLSVILAKTIVWIVTDAPLYTKSVAYLFMISLILIMRNKWTFWIGLILFILPLLFRIATTHVSGLNSFDFTNNIYIYFRDTHPGFARLLLHFPTWFYSFMILLFCLPFTWKAYGFRQKRSV